MFLRLHTPRIFCSLLRGFYTKLCVFFPVIFEDILHMQEVTIGPIPIVFRETMFKNPKLTQSHRGKTEKLDVPGRSKNR